MHVHACVCVRWLLQGEQGCLLAHCLCSFMAAYLFNSKCECNSINKRFALSPEQRGRN